MKLTRGQRNQLYRGDFSALTYPVEYGEDDDKATRKAKMEAGKPDWKIGQCVVVARQRFKAVYDHELKQTFTPEPEPVFWITITRIVYRAKGEWVARYDVTDLRQRRRMVRRGLPPHDMDQQLKDWQSPPNTEEVAEASEESAYTGNPNNALDHLDAVPADYNQSSNTDLHRKQRAALREAQRARLSIGRQLDSLLQDAQESRKDVRSRARRIEREVALLKQDLKDAA